MTESARYEISTDPRRLDIALIHDFLANSYWAAGIPRALVEKSIRNSLCFGAYLGPKQVAFARVVTDCSTFGYLADVFVVPGHRGKGVSKLLMRSILDHPELQGLRRFMLATRDAHGLYEQFGFKPVAKPEDLMAILLVNPYEKADGAANT